MLLTYRGSVAQVARFNQMGNHSTLFLQKGVRSPTQCSVPWLRHLCSVWRTGVMHCINPHGPPASRMISHPCRDPAQVSLQSLGGSGEEICFPPAEGVERCLYWNKHFTGIGNWWGKKFHYVNPLFLKDTCTPTHIDLFLCMAWDR